MTNYPTPKEDGITIPRLDTIPFATAFGIKAATGVDLYTADFGERMPAAAWWFARQLDEYRGITFDYVRENWSLAQIHAVNPYDDADSVLETVETLPVEPDPVIPEDGIGFPLVDS